MSLVHRLHVTFLVACEVELFHERLQSSILLGVLKREMRRVVFSNFGVI